MREYGQVSPAFWIGDTGKLLRGDAPAQVLALYLMTSPHSNMTGVFHCPVLYMGYETGLGVEGASKGLKRLLEVGFCEYDDTSECVFVLRMAAYQIAESLKPGDNRIAGLRKEVAKMAPLTFRHRFLDVYGSAFCLMGDENTTEGKPLTSPLQAPSKGLIEKNKAPPQGPILRAGAGAGAGVEAPSPPTLGGDHGNASPSASPAIGRRLPENWEPSEALQSWAADKRPDLDIALTTENFVDFWRSKPGKDGRKTDWDATFRNWVRNQNVSGKFPAKSNQINGFEGGI